MAADTNTPERDTNLWDVERCPFSVVSTSVLGFALANSGQQVPDLGCGTGGYAARLADDGHQVVAAETNPDHLAAAKLIETV